MDAFVKTAPATNLIVVAITKLEVNRAGCVTRKTSQRTSATVYGNNLFDSFASGLTVSPGDARKRCKNDLYFRLMTYLAAYYHSPTSIDEHQIKIPTTISAEDPVKIIGHSLKGRKFTLNPVNNDTMDSTFS